ncbi:MAG TPA: choice-of-anchor tandem repeat GloVer-containing protein [Tepidisphaeraceae bacterium]|jgi:uncharacterized repeat protein (TIGR03803 family)
MVEALEERRLLSGYAVNPLDRMGLNSTGANPRTTLTLDAAGNLYGTTQAGGQYGHGTVFEIVNGSSTIATLGNFVDPQGSSTAPLLVDQNGNLFGTTRGGGANGLGTLFEVVKGSSAITTLVSFTYATGTHPLGGLVADGNGNLFGTTETGGVNGVGSIFELLAGTSTITILASPRATDYYSTGGIVVDTDGNLFGTTAYTVFEVASGSKTVRTLITFPNSGGTGGPTPGLVMDQAGNLFGSIQQGGSFQYGSLFEIVKGSTSLTTLASFTGPNGKYPGVPYIDHAGNLFGIAYGGGSSGGSIVYELPAGSSTLATLASFQPSASAGIVMDGTGRIYGVTDSGGPASTGSIFTLAPGGATVATVATFGSTSGMYPNPGLATDADGNLWGTAARGGSTNDGVLYELDHRTGMATTIAYFDGVNGHAPNGNVVIDDNGNIFGTTSGGGVLGYGNVFEWVKSTGAINTVYSFDRFEENVPAGGLIRDTAGNLYGTTGSYETGAIFEIAAGTHAYSVLATLDGSTGSSPFGPLTLDSSGNLYGTASRGGLHNFGTIFELTAGSSAVTDIASFNARPNGGLLLDAAGNIYATTSDGGDGGGGVFEVRKGSGVLTTIASFDIFNSGSRPNGELLMDQAGNLFGTLQDSPFVGKGEIFEIRSGATTVIPIALIPFDDIGSPLAIVRDSDGTFRGVSFGADGYGVFFQATPAAPNITLRRDADLLHIDWTIGSKSGQAMIADHRGLSLTGDGGNDVITLDYSNGNPLPNILHLNGAFTINGLIGPDPLNGTTVEMGKSTLYLGYVPGFSSAAKIQQDLVEGYEDGHCYGFATASTGAIMSFDLYPPGPYALGFADSSDGIVSGQPANTIEIRYTVMGDANLDGIVNSTDAILMARHYMATGSPAWDAGNFNYDSTINLADATLLQANFGKSLAPSAISSAASGTVGIAAVVAPIVNPPPPVETSPVLSSTANDPTSNNRVDDDDATPLRKSNKKPDPHKRGEIHLRDVKHK